MSNEMPETAATGPIRTERSRTRNPTLCGGALVGRFIVVA
jgi:hypothetical protein